LPAGLSGSNLKGMDIPLWAVFGLIAASLSSVMMLLQERFRVDGFALAFWCKVACATLALPFVLAIGAPSDPLFYLMLAGQAVLWAISDVIFFNTIPKVGAGVVSRILPVSVIAGFFLWFLIDPALLQTYLETPLLSLGVVLALFGSVYFAVRLRACAISWGAVRMLWFVIFAAVIGPLVHKILLGHASFSKGPFAFVFFESLLMVAMWLAYYAARRPIPANVLFSKESAKAGFMVGGVMMFMVAANVAALSLVDNPALVPAVKFTDTILILLFYRFTGRKDHSDILAGLGIVACAAAIIVLKSIS